MTEEEIKALALSLGLEPSRLMIYEPRFNAFVGAYEYRLEYLVPEIAAYNHIFTISEEDVIGAKSLSALIRCYVTSCLTQLAEVVKPK